MTHFIFLLRVMTFFCSGRYSLGALVVLNLVSVPFVHPKLIVVSCGCVVTPVYCHAFSSVCRPCTVDRISYAHRIQYSAYRFACVGVFEAIVFLVATSGQRNHLFLCFFLFNPNLGPSFCHAVISCPVDYGVL